MNSDSCNRKQTKKNYLREMMNRVNFQKADLKPLVMNGDGEHITALVHLLNADRSSPDTPWSYNSKYKQLLKTKRTEFWMLRDGVNLPDWNRSCQVLDRFLSNSSNIILNRLFWVSLPLYGHHYLYAPATMLHSSNLKVVFQEKSMWHQDAIMFTVKIELYCSCVLLDVLIELQKYLEYFLEVN